LGASEEILGQVVGGEIMSRDLPCSKGLLALTNQRLFVVTMSVIAHLQVGIEFSQGNFSGAEDGRVWWGDEKWQDFPLPKVHEWRLGQKPAELIGTKDPLMHRGWITSIREVGPPDRYLREKPGRKAAWLTIWANTSWARTQDFWVLKSDPGLEVFLKAFRGVLQG
jgi:hypothetical protein